MLDGQEVHIGDSVHVIGTGDGIVSSVSADGSFTIKLGDKGSLRVRDGGYVGNVRKVYWFNPIIIVPPKNMKLWINAKKMAQINYDILLDLYNNGMVKDEVIKDVEHDADEV